MRTSAECTDSPVAHGVLVRYADKLSAVRETVEQEMRSLRIKSVADDLAVKAYQAQIERSLAVLSPNMPSSGLEDACHQVKQVAISEAENSELAEKIIASLRAQLTVREDEREAIRNELPKEWREGDLLECVMATVEELGCEKRNREAAEAEVDRLKAELERLRDVVSPADVELIDAALAPSSAETGHICLLSLNKFGHCIICGTVVAAPSRR